MLAYQAAAKAVPPWPPSPAAIPLHWRHRLLTLQTANHRYCTPTDHDAYTYAAIYPDAIALTAAAGRTDVRVDRAEAKLHETAMRKPPRF